MKVLKLSLFVVVLTSAFLFSCKKDVNNEQTTDQSPYLTVKIVGAGIAANLSPELIQVIKKQMVAQNRASDTTKLLRTYDSKTGKLLIEVKDAITIPSNFEENQMVDSSIINQNNDTVMATKNLAADPWNQYYLKYKAHVQNVGWQALVGAGQLAGTTFQSKRMEAFVISHDNIYPMDVPDLRYQAYVDNDGWKWEQTWNGVAGTTGRNLTMRYLKIYTPTYGYTISYYVHISYYGDAGPYYNGATAGNGNRIEGLYLWIYKW